MVFVVTPQSVVDCSVAVKWKIASEPHHAEAVELLLDVRAGAMELIAPAVFPAEVISAFLRWIGDYTPRR